MTDKINDLMALIDDYAAHAVNFMNFRSDENHVAITEAEANLRQALEAALKPGEPVATLWQHGETGRTRITQPGDITDCDASWFKAADLFAHPPRREPVPSDGWLQEGSLLYRLTDESKPRNRDEINVTMADGSRSEASRTRRAGELLDRIRERREPLTDPQIATVYWGATGQSLRPQDNALAHKFARAIEAAHGITP